LPPNNALHDQLRAFDWIHQNIAGFGGDPDRITALGQSAGSMSLALHSISANPDPLFQQIVCLSGSPVTMPSKSPARYDETFSSLAEKLGVQDIPKKNATEFAHEFTHAQLEKIRDLSYVGAPCTSSEILPYEQPPTSPIHEETDLEDGDYEETVLVVRRGRTVLEINEKDEEEEQEQLETTPTRRSERTTIVDDDILRPFTTLPRRSRQPPHTLPLPIPSPTVVDTLPCSRRLVPNPSDTSLSSHDRFLSLSKLPGRSKPLPGRFVTSFQDVARRLAKAYLDNPSEGTLLDFLAFPKVGDITDLRTNNPRAFIEQYPNVRWPEAGMIGRGRSARDAVVKAVENGKLGTSARLLEGKSIIAEIDDVTLSALDSKHRTGPSSPFGPTVGPTQGRAPTAEDVQAVLDDFKADVSPGISGWTVPLLRHAARTTEVMDVLVSLTGSIGANVAPGSSMLTTSRLTPLVKPDGGIHPIACGELIYRLATKALLQKAFKPDFLEAFQLGVGSKGGVEPIVRLVERSTFGDLRAKWSHLVSLDASNAFNAWTVAQSPLRPSSSPPHSTGRRNVHTTAHLS